MEILGGAFRAVVRRTSHPNTAAKPLSFHSEPLQLLCQRSSGTVQFFYSCPEYRRVSCAPSQEEICMVVKYESIELATKRLSAFSFEAG